MSKRGIKLHFDGADTEWVMDTEIHGNFVMFGFEEHSEIDCECHGNKKCFLTEKLLDELDLKLIKALVDKTLEQLQGADNNGTTRISEPDRSYQK